MGHVSITYLLNQHSVMPIGTQKTLKPKPPDKGSFPLDHEGTDFYTVTSMASSLCEAIEKWIAFITALNLQESARTTW